MKSPESDWKLGLQELSSSQVVLLEAKPLWSCAWEFMTVNYGQWPQEVEVAFEKEPTASLPNLSFWEPLLWCDKGVIEVKDQYTSLMNQLHNWHILYNRINLHHVHWVSVTFRIIFHMPHGVMKHKFVSKALSFGSIDRPLWDLYTDKN